MIRATVHVEQPDEVLPAYEILKNFEEVNIVKVRNRMATEYQHITVFFVYKDVNVGEIEIRYGTKAVNYFAHRFL